MLLNGIQNICKSSKLLKAGRSPLQNSCCTGEFSLLYTYINKYNVIIRHRFFRSFYNDFFLIILSESVLNVQSGINVYDQFPGLYRQIATHEEHLINYNANKWTHLKVNSELKSEQKHFYESPKMQNKLIYCNLYYYIIRNKTYMRRIVVFGSVADSLRSLFLVVVISTNVNKTLFYWSVFYEF